MNKKANETLTRLLPELLQGADPITHEGELPAADTARMRRAIVAEAAAYASADVPGKRTSRRPALFWLPAAAAAALAVGLGLVLFFALNDQRPSNTETVATGSPHGASMLRAPLLRADMPARPSDTTASGSVLDLPTEPAPFPGPSAPAPRVARSAPPVAPAAAPALALAPESLLKPEPILQAATALPDAGIERFPASTGEPARLVRAIEPVLEASPNIEASKGGKATRRMNLTAPGGTRILWVIDPELEIDSTETTSER